MLLSISNLVLKHFLNEHAGTDALKIPLATFGEANAICKLTAVVAITRDDINHAFGIQAIDCGAGTIRRNPHALGKRFARETIRPAIVFGLLVDFHQHQHLNTLHIVDTRTTLARHSSLLKPSTSI
ncbi:hypothetical protein COLAER_00350 [Collinsella aerofaciens ATCC 25986]|uniref:Uncharacterized protein n=1 Tax=Collinsella aerofaciens (strain ATCC 25986 / DSM 3979 / JCM 10188 / KCTC 3647 / NCTC 11838 / VPI 1003) TaxID=411903 RepID=A4E7G9_COLAA|nr:hypothetical protein COLAER_00350 [Collinsella aerofaciens ATCC 25986]